jgi:hypothetical protein
MTPYQIPYFIRKLPNGDFQLGLEDKPTRMQYVYKADDKGNLILQSYYQDIPKNRNLLFLTCESVWNPYELDQFMASDNVINNLTGYEQQLIEAEITHFWKQKKETCKITFLFDDDGFWWIYSAGYDEKIAKIENGVFEF